MSDNMMIASSVNNLMKEFEIITNNIANINNVGYKRRSSTFMNVMDEQGSGVNNDADSLEIDSEFVFSQGNLIQTERKLDFGLYGSGFFVVETPEGPLYTRNGVFRTNASGQIVDSLGRTVCGESGTITIPANTSMSEVTVGSDGMLRAGGATIGKFKLVDFGEDESLLESAGFSCFSKPEDVREAKAENVVVKQGFHEASNVNMVSELVNLIKVSRLYETNMKYLSKKSDASQSLMRVAMG